MRGKIVLAICFALGTNASIALADGGDLRFSERRGSYVITVFTAPTPPRAGVVDVSVLVQAADSGQPLPEVPVVVHAWPGERFDESVSFPATTDTAANKLMRAAQLELVEPGRWHIEIAVQGCDVEPPISFDMEVAAAPPPWLHLSLWIGWPFAAIGVFAVHQWLVFRCRPISRAAGALRGYW